MHSVHQVYDVLARHQAQLKQNDAHLLAAIAQHLLLTRSHEISSSIELSLHVVSLLVHRYLTPKRLDTVQQSSERVGTCTNKGLIHSWRHSDRLRLGNGIGCEEVGGTRTEHIAEKDVRKRTSAEVNECENVARR